MSEWQNEYVDILGLLLDDNMTVPVFTPDHKFISTDGFHLSKAGAQFLAQELFLNRNFDKTFPLPVK